MPRLIIFVAAAFLLATKIPIERSIWGPLDLRLLAMIPHAWLQSKLILSSPLRQRLNENVPGSLSNQNPNLCSSFPDAPLLPPSHHPQLSTCTGHVAFLTSTALSTKYRGNPARGREERKSPVPPGSW